MVVRSARGRWKGAHWLETTSWHSEVYLEVPDLLIENETERHPHEAPSIGSVGVGQAGQEGSQKADGDAELVERDEHAAVVRRRHFGDVDALADGRQRHGPADAETTGQQRRVVAARGQHQRAADEHAGVGHDRPAATHLVHQRTYIITRHW